MSAVRRPRPSADLTPQHIGLWIDRFADDRKDLSRAADVPVPPVYSRRFARWLSALEDLSRASEFDHVARVQVEAQGRLIVGIGADSVHEVGLTLQWVDGAPVVPGSALKGLAAHYAATQAALGGEHLGVLFGTTASAGYITWFDAWYVPGSAPADRPLVHDVMTVHHPVYYGSRGRERAPWDLDDPTPVPFASVRGRFLVAVQGPSQSWARFAVELLTRALADWGVGAKTSSDYGRLLRVADPPSVPRPASAPTAATAPREHPLIAQIRAIPPNRLRQEIGGIVDGIGRLPESERQPVIAALVDRLHGANQWSWAQGRPWFTKLGLDEGS